MKVNAYRSTENRASRPASFQHLPLTNRVAVERVERSLSQQIRFPEPAITRDQPNRYNTQCNDQITAIQIADHYLSATQQHIDILLSTLPYRDDVDTQPSLSAFIEHLQKRRFLAGGVVDSQLKVNIIDEPKLRFRIIDSEHWFAEENQESLLFSTLFKGVKQYAMVNIKANDSMQAQLTQLNLGLGKLGIRALMSAEEGMIFSVDEKQGEEIIQHLMVQGQGKYYPDDHFVPMKIEFTASVLGTLTPLIQQSEHNVTPLIHELQTLYYTLSEQRSLLINDRQQLQQNFTETLAKLASEGVKDYARHLNQALNQGQLNYAAISQLLQAQPYLHKETVKTIIR